jgi:hypothetical protein
LNEKEKLVNVLLKSNVRIIQEGRRDIRIKLIHSKRGSQVRASHFIIGVGFLSVLASIYLSIYIYRYSKYKESLLTFIHR